MTTAITDVVKEDLTTPADPFDMGAGRIDLDAAVNAPITFDETASRFAALGDDPLHGRPPQHPVGQRTRHAGPAYDHARGRQRDGPAADLHGSGTAPAGSTITVEPAAFTVDPGQPAVVTITIESDAPIGAQQFGEVWLQADSGTTLHLPVAFIHTQGS